MSEPNKHLSAVFDNRKTVLEVLHQLQQAGIEQVSVRSREPLEQTADELRNDNGSTESAQALRDNTPTEANEGLDPISLSLPPVSEAEHIEDATSLSGLYRDPLTGMSSETEIDRERLSSFHHILEHKGLDHAQAEAYEKSYEAHHYLLLVDEITHPERLKRAKEIIQQSQPSLSHSF